jgi:hypothetical protein
MNRVLFFDYRLQGLGYTASSGRRFVNSELERIWKAAAVA